MTNASMSDIVQSEIGRWKREGMTPRQINFGNCDAFANDVLTVAHQQGFDCEEMDTEYMDDAPQDLHGHVWVYCNDDKRHYDAETPFGVEEWKDLPYFKRAMMKESQNIGSKATFYHATNRDSIESIYYNGLVPQDDHRWGGDIAEFSDGKVFVTKNFDQAVYYGNAGIWNLETYEFPVILRLQYDETQLTKDKEARFDYYCTNAIKTHFQVFVPNETKQDPVYGKFDINQKDGVWRDLTQNIAEAISDGEWDEETMLENEMNESKDIDIKIRELKWNKKQVLFHGTDQTLETFELDDDYERIGGRFGIEMPDGFVFLTNDKKEAEVYGNYVIEVTVDAKSVFVIRVNADNPSQIFDDDYNDPFGYLWSDFWNSGCDVMEIRGSTKSTFIVPASFVRQKIGGIVSESKNDYPYFNKERKRRGMSHNYMDIFLYDRRQNSVIPELSVTHTPEEAEEESADSGVLEDITEGFSMEDEWLYHGTTSNHMDGILEHGIKSPSWWGSYRIAKEYASNTLDAERGFGAPVIIKKRMSDFDKSAFVVDSPSIEEPLTFTLGKSEEDVWEEWEECDGTWEDCLNIVESVKYMKHIDIKREDISALSSSNTFVKKMDLKEAFLKEDENNENNKY